MQEGFDSMQPSRPLHNVSLPVLILVVASSDTAGTTSETSRGLSSAGSSGSSNTMPTGTALHAYKKSIISSHLLNGESKLLGWQACLLPHS